MRRIVYLMSGNPHLPYLVASLMTLRKWWDGEVSVYSWPDSWEIVKQVAADDRLGVWGLLREPEYRGHCDQFLDKIKLVSELGGDETVLYLDADTTIHGKLDPLFDAAESCGFCATQFNNWTLANGIPRSRVNELRQFPEIPVDLIDRVVSNPTLPSVNGGVFCCRPASPVLATWRQWTEPALSTYIADEKVLHLLALKYGETEEMMVALGGRWNCSPKYQPADLPDSEVIVRHYHGDSNVRPGKSDRGYMIWWPIWSECVRKNLGGCRGWWKGVGNKWINRLTEEQRTIA